MHIENTTIGSSQSLTNQFGKYDPQLDLASYKYPNLDLLENYGDSITVS